ncbi:hypothetical protein COU13_00010 [Candidatus Kaiserbacteria bacterium CG10_big_fil_rev_8_21_14_0_10_43_70]|uniref:CSD domain-containing protein n=1 Tax=Candidatus Kaiserbacteria bacterium CG10_big_fil_rev_8_21_14_0_10_43_70 TaxID=1974605 RepID=A0A2H0UJL9_9BACT|nr:MAG: hypothetical protein COU13_00010 [Candidatus Kaiserbacteria bacterium CG10_big_fil_rev_8_21_14_0_10_43_70]
MPTFAHGIVKFFNEDKGFGFIVPDDSYPINGDVFLQERVIPTSLPLPEAGSRIEFAYKKGEKGWEATAVTDVGDIDEDFLAKVNGSGKKNRRRDVMAEFGPVSATVKSFRGDFGFFENPEGPDDPDIFVHKEVLTRHDLSGLQRGDRALITYIKTKKSDGSDGLRVVEIESVPSEESTQAPKSATKRTAAKTKAKKEPAPKSATRKTAAKTKKAASKANGAAVAAG